MSCFGIGCAVLVFIPIAGYLTVSGAGWLVLVIIAFAIWLSVRNQRAKNNSGSLKSTFATDYATFETNSGASHTLAASATTSAVVVDSSRQEMINPVCAHKFYKETLESKPSVTCDCNHFFDSKELLHFNKLLADKQSLEVRIQNLVQTIREQVSGSKPQTSNSVLSSTEVASAPAAVKAKTATAEKPVAKPKVQRPKARLSLAQWLILGASVLVMIAGVTFVATTRSTLPQYVFTLITAIVAILTGYGAFAMRKFSVLISNFMATFATTMLWATTWTLGEELSGGIANGGFTWDNRPAWWQTIEFVVVAIASALLAKFSRNFGFKAIALLSTLAATLTFALATLGDPTLQISLGVSLSLLSLGSAAILTLNRWLRKIPQFANADSDSASYFADLAEREDKTLGIAGRLAAGLMLVSAIGLLVSRLPELQGDWITFVALAVVWVVIDQLHKLWADQLSNEKSFANVQKLIRGVPLVSLSLAGTTFAAALSEPMTMLTISFVSLTVLQLAALLPSRFKPTRIQIDLSFYAGVMAWFFMLPTDLTIEGGALFVFGLSVILVLSDLIHKTNRFGIAANVVGLISLITYAQSLRSSQFEQFSTLNFALLAVFVVLLSNLHLAINFIVVKRANKAMSQANAWVSVAAGIALTYMFATPFENNFQNYGLEPRLNLIYSFLAYSAVLQGLAAFTKFGKSLSNQLSTKSYVAQSLVLVGIFSDYNGDRQNAATYALLVALVTAINYTFGAISRSSMKLQVGYATILSAMFVFEWSLTNQNFEQLLIEHILIVVAVTWLHSWLLRKRSQASQLVLPAVLGISYSLVILPFMMSGIFGELPSAALYELTITLSITAVIAAVVSELKAVAKVATRVSTLRYSSLLYAAFASGYALLTSTDSTLADRLIRGIAATAILVAITHWRVAKSDAKIWSVAAWVSSLSLAAWLGFAINQNISYNRPELYAMLFALSIFSTATLTRVKSFELRVTLPVAIATVPSMIWALSDSENNLITGIAASAILTSYAYLRVSRSPNTGWIFASYFTSATLAGWSGYAIYIASGKNFAGPEFISLPISGALLLSNRFALRTIEMKNSMLRWGLPTAISVIPSIIYSYGALQTPITELDALQIARPLLVALLAGTFLILGARRGSLGLTVTGLVGLGLIIVPNTAAVSTDGAKVDSTAIVTAAFVLALLSILRAAGKLKGNSLVYIGIPVALGLGPAMINSLLALNHPLTSVDWLRFSIVMISGLVLLFVGTMREVAGMFYPGLATVLITALPYGFNQTDQQSWLLWVVLLLVAGIMVWLALHLEKMRKAGRESANWFKEMR